MYSYTCILDATRNVTKTLTNFKACSNWNFLLLQKKLLVLIDVSGYWFIIAKHIINRYPTSYYTTVNVNYLYYFKLILLLLLNVILFYNLDVQYVFVIKNILRLSPCRSHRSPFWATDQVTGRHKILDVLLNWPLFALLANIVVSATCRYHLHVSHLVIL